MSDTKRHKSIYSFLESSGVLESNDDDIIKKARQAYWRSYHREYKRAQRGKMHEHTILLDKHQEALFQREATILDMSIASYIKECSLAYRRKQYLPINREELIKAEQSLSHIRTLLEQYKELSSVRKEASKTLQDIEAHLYKLCCAPRELSEELRATIDKHPAYLETLKQIILEYDHQK